MSNNPRGRPTKSLQHKKRVKQAADQKRYLHSKLNSERTLTASTSEANYQEGSKNSHESVSHSSIYIKYQ